MLSFKALSEKKTKIKINPRKEEMMEKMKNNHGEDCDCMKCEKKRRSEDVNDGPDIASESAVPGKPAEKLKTDRNMFNIPKDEQDAAKERLKAKAAAKRKAKLNKEENAYVSQEEVSEESTEEVAETETSLLTFRQFNEDRAADAKASLEKVKARQKVLDAHEKKTGKKLDINKSVEARDHKKNFPGAKRTGKKVKGAKETPAQTQDRRIRQASTRIATKGYTSKEKKEVKSMAKHASRFD